MFDFEGLEVYQLAKQANREVLHFLATRKDIDAYIRDQWKRASISSVINIAEGSGKFSKADRRNFYTTARGSIYECVALAQIVFDSSQMSEEEANRYYARYEQISKMLLGLIHSQQ